MNQVILTGNLTKDVTLKTTNNGKIATFTLAHNKGEKANYFDCITFDKRAELVDMYCKKGSKLLIRGELTQDVWQAQDGSNRSAIRILVNEVEFLSKKEATDPEEPAEPVEEEQTGELPF